MNGLTPQSGPEPMAIVGMGCRMPGSVRSPTDLWNLILSKIIANSDRVPKSRFDIDAYLHPSNERPGSFNVSGGYFIDDDLEAFDPGLFDISHVEALCLDPQQRKLLEVVYEAFESSGTTLEDAAAQKTGCFVGSFTHDFMHMTLKEPDFRHTYNGIGIDSGMLANRISYAFNLDGPSLSINTACSSSLYALDLACKAIAAGQCDSAIVGGVNLILHVDQQMNTARLGVLSPTNQCHTFDEAADGYSRADGIGALYVKPLNAAIKNGDPIRAIIRGTAVGSNGRCKDGITHPSIEGQMETIDLAYKYAHLSPDQTAYVECHGTGTPVGDPIEVEAIHRAMGASESRTSPVFLGSVKPNIGHSEAASSMGTIIKSIMALENDMLPPTAGLERPHPNIKWNDFNIRVITEPTPWPTSMPVRRIGINAFGYGGTNAHAILDNAASLVPPAHLKGWRSVSRPHSSRAVNGHNWPSENEDDYSHLLVFSAHDEPTLRNNLADYAARCRDAPLLDLAYTLGKRRSKFKRRAFAIAKQGSLTSVVQDATATITTAPSDSARIAFVFTGQGAQWPQMGASLMRRYPRVRSTIRRLDRHLSRLAAPPNWTIEDALKQPAESSVVNDAEFAQPLSTAVQIALVDLLTHWGIRPLATIGHSSGEIAAAYGAGRISAEKAITAAYFRGKVVATLQQDGAMLAVGMGANQVTSEYLNREDMTWPGRLVVACHNSPNAVTLSGDAEAIEKLRLVLEEDNIFARVVKTGGKAYHSPHMKDAALSYERFLNEEAPDNDAATECLLQKIPMFSTVKTAQIGHGQMPWSYWADNLSKPVLFEQGVRLMLTEVADINLLIEIGPHGALAGPLREICQTMGKSSSLQYLSTLKRKEHDVDQMLRLAGNLWARKRNYRYGEDLPPYHWTYSKPCWSESRLSREQRQQHEARHDILGRRVMGTSNLEPMWRNVLRQKDLPWLCQHTIGGEVLVPGAAYLAEAIEALTQINEQSDKPAVIETYTLQDVVISSATVVPDNDDIGTETLFIMQPVDGKMGSQWYQFTASCLSYGAWKETVRGRIGFNIIRNQQPQPFPETPRPDEHIHWLEKLRSVGINLGPAFHHIGTMHSTDESHSASGDMGIVQACGLMEQESRYVLHPTVIDSCMQLFVPTIHQGHLDAARCGTVPTHFGEVTIAVPTPEQLARRCLLQVWTPELTNRAYTSHIQLLADDGAMLVNFTDCRHILYGSAIPRDIRGPMNRDLYMKQDWKLDADYVHDQAQGISFARMLDILMHKEAGPRSLCMDPSLVPTILAVRPRIVLDVATWSMEARDTLLAHYGDNEDITVLDLSGDSFKESWQDSLKGAYDLVISKTVNQMEEFQNITKVLTPAGHLLIQNGPSWDMEAATTLLLADGSVLAAVPKQPHMNGVNGVGHRKSAIIVYPETPTSSLLDHVTHELTKKGWEIRHQSLNSIESVSRNEDRVIFVDEDADHGTVLAKLRPEHLQGLIHLTESASSMVWITSGGLLTGDRPVVGLTTGAARVIRSEKGSQLDLVTLDFDAETTSMSRVACLAADILGRQHAHGRNGEIEYWVKTDKVHIGRLVPHSHLNREFVSDSGETTLLRPSDGHVAVHGQLHQVTGELTYYHDQREEVEPGQQQPLLEDDDVEVSVKAIGLTPFDGVDDSTYLSHQLAGVVTRIGAKVDATHISPGTRVLGLAFNGQLGTIQRTSSRLVQPLAADCCMNEAATVASSFSTAIYGLEELARVEPGETVAIVDGMGAVGMAAVQMCRIVGANALVITASESTQRALIDNGLVGPSCQVVMLRGDGSLRNQVEKTLAAKTCLDVVLCLNSAHSKSVFEAISTSLSRFARIVSVGPGGNHDLSSISSPLKRGMSWFSFDLHDVMERPAMKRYAQSDLTTVTVSFTNRISRVVERCGKLYREGRIRIIHPIKVVDPSHVGEVLQSSTTSGDLGRELPVVSYHDEAVFKVLGPSQPPLKLKSDATYLLVGCLGGLGRHVAIRMAEQCAKYLVFLSRSGTDNSAAADTVEVLRAQGVNVLVLRADIRQRDSLSHALTELEQRDDFPPVRGMLNAAGYLNDKLFRNMTVETWQEVVDTKMLGAMNLHHALEPFEPLDFFVMTSSVASALGASGQSNYAAANSFLDTLATHRRARGLAGLSLVLPAIFGIGYIAEHTEIEQSIQSRGMYGIRKKEMLEAFDVALAPQPQLVASSPDDADYYDHIIVGIQPRRYALALQAAEAHAPWDEDPHYNWMGVEIGKQSKSGTDNGAASSSQQQQQNVRVAIQKSASPEAAIETVTAHVARRLARLLMLDETKVLEEASRGSVASHGLDSMIGAEFRNWIFREFGVDVPFQQLLGGSFTISELAAILYDKVVENQKT
ncbi:hypothetical protein G7054_g6912 [Neopestalotiopsis clavispora]|nr:hypothetical protein G7054_g6912 [Neopestalotiopsis clavispora]